MSPPLESGKRYEFICLQIDIAGHSKLDDPDDVLHAVKSLFHREVDGIARVEGGVPFKWEGDGGAFLFPASDPAAFENCIEAACKILHRMPGLNERVRNKHGLSKPLHVRISLDHGSAIYDDNPGLITGDFLNAFLKNERDNSLVDGITITDRIHRQIPLYQRAKFEPFKLSDSLKRQLYRQIPAARVTTASTEPPENFA
jgi:hypothetical protein